MKLREIDTTNLIECSKGVMASDKKATEPIDDINDLYMAVRDQIRSRDRLIVEMTKVIIAMDKRDRYV